MLNNVDVTVSVAGDNVHFVSLNLKQGFNKHHEFRIVVNFEDLFKGELWMKSPIKLIKLIGEPIVVAMKQRVTGETNDFRGIITNVSAEGKHGQQNNYVITGMSDTIRLEGKQTMDSFIDSNLAGVVAEIATNSGNGAKINIAPLFDEKIDYICQYNETAFEVINRLSWIYGEWFFNDGVDTYFGKPQSLKEFDLFYDMELTYFNMTANLVPANFTYYDYLVHDAKEAFSQAPDSVPGVRGYIKVAMDKSAEFYTSNSYMPSDPTVNSSIALNQLADMEKARSVAGMLVFTGESTSCKVRIGSVANIKLPLTMKVEADVESFLITEVEHIINEKGYYSNIFSGMPSGIANVPMEEIGQPLTSSQVATVKSNADSKGRVKVQFQWQKALGKTTNWLRVQTPDGGSSDEVSSNRGFVFIPEEGDEVVIGFTNGDPSRPFVTGAIFPETKSAGGGDSNKQKSLTTRSGVAMTLDDSCGSATLKDPSGNSVHQDGAGNITITAPNSFTVNCGDGAAVLEMKNDGSIKLTSKLTIDLDAETHAKIKVVGNTITIEPESTDVDTPNTIKLASASNTIMGTNQITGGDTKIDGGNVFIN